MKVLVVDDSRLELIVTKDTFIKAGHEVETASDMKFIDQVKRFQPDVIILDYHIGNELGTSAIPTIRDLPLEKQPIILICTSSAAEQMVNVSATSGADGYIPKGGSKSVVVEKVEELFAASELATE